MRTPEHPELKASATSLVIRSQPDGERSELSMPPSPHGYEKSGITPLSLNKEERVSERKREASLLGADPPCLQSLPMVPPVKIILTLGLIVFKILPPIAQLDYHDSIITSEPMEHNAAPTRPSTFHENPLKITEGATVKRRDLAAKNQ
jgi:hypothetical protein